MSAPNDQLSDKNKKGKYAYGKQNQDDMPSQALEHGDIFFFFYRLKVAAGEVTGIDDIRRFFMVNATDITQPRTETEGRKEAGGSKDESQGFYGEDRARWSNDGHYPLPHGIGSSRWAKNPFRKSGIQRPDRWSERYRAKIGGLFHEPKDFRGELLSAEYREGDSAVLLA